LDTIEWVENIKDKSLSEENKVKLCFDKWKIAQNLSDDKGKETRNKLQFEVIAGAFRMKIYELMYI
jgi:hypothetical protein